MKLNVKPLEWDEPKKPDLYCSYDYTKANGAGLTYQIEWKSWKDYPGYTLDAGENMIGCFDTLDAAKSAAFADYSARIMSAIEPAGAGVETPPPSTHVAGEEACILCGQTCCDVCKDLDDTVASESDRPLVPSKDDVRHALETIELANGADLDDWTGGILPSDDIREALAAIKSSRENKNAR